MPAHVHEFDRPERFVVGTVGQPGERTFYLQARSASRLVSVMIEKEQALALAAHLVEMLDQVRSSVDPDVPRDPPTGTADTAPLDTPIEAEFRVGALSLAWDSSDGSVVVEARAIGPEEPGTESGDDASETEPEAAEASDEERDTLVVRMGPEQALAFAARARRVVAAGRRPCPLCGLPLSPHGHVCPRDNGYRRGSPA